MKKKPTKLKGWALRRVSRKERESRRQRRMWREAWGVIEIRRLTVEEVRELPEYKAGGQ